MSTDLASIQQSYEYNRLFVFSGRSNANYLLFSELIRNVAKYMTEIHGLKNYGYNHDGLVDEATTLEFLACNGGSGSTSQSWLP